MYLEHLKHASATPRGLQLTFISGDTEHSIELSTKAAGQLLHAFMTSGGTGGEQLTMTVLGHQVVRAPEAYGLLLRTLELGDVVFSLPQAILRRLVSDLMHLASSLPTATCKPEVRAPHASGKTAGRA